VCQRWTQAEYRNGTEMETSVQHDDADKRAKIEKGKRLLDRYEYVCGSGMSMFVDPMP